MNGMKRHEKDLMWESVRIDIERKFVKKGQSLEEIRSWLQAKGFHVTKNQLNYRLNKIWGVRSKAPRGQAREFWGSVRQLQESEQSSGHGQLGSFVLSNRQRLRPVHWQRGIRRNDIQIYSSHSASCEVAFALKSHFDRPLQSDKKLSSHGPMTCRGWSPVYRDSRSEQATMQTRPPADPSLAGTNGNFLGYLSASFREDGGRLNSHRSSLAIPPGENNTRAERQAQILLTGQSNESTEEQLKLLLARISNGLITASWADDSFWNMVEFLLGVIEQAGLLNSLLDFQQKDFTLRSVSDALFQTTFRFLCATFPRKDKLSFDVNRAQRVLSWLLRSGQDPNIPIRVAVFCETRTTGLQISLALAMSDLATELLACGANPNGLQTGSRMRLLHEEHYALHPLFLANSYGQSVLTQLESYGASLFDELAISPFSFSFVDVFHQHPSLDPIPALFHLFEGAGTRAVLQYLFDHTDERGSFMYRYLVDWNNLWVHAAGAGNLVALEYLLLRHSDMPTSSTSYEYANWSNDWDITALHAAVLARRNSTETCHFLFQHSVTFDDDSDLPQLACIGSMETIQLLHEKGADARKCCSRRSRLWDLLGKQLEIDPLRDTSLKIRLQCRGLSHMTAGAQSVDIYKYLIKHGSDVPLDLLDFALQEAHVELLSLSLNSATNIIDRYQQNPDYRRSPLFVVLSFYKFWPNRTGFNGKEAVQKLVAMAHLLLDAGAQVEAGDAMRPAFLGDWDLVTRIMTFETGLNPKARYRVMQTALNNRGTRSDRMDITILEAAILSGAQHIALQAFKLDPTQYDASALCAATLMASVNGNGTIIRALLSNRKLGELHEEQAYEEMTAIGIAAQSGNQELFSLLRSQLPWSTQAYVPDPEEFDIAFNPSPQYESLWRPQFIRFWSEGFLDSFQIFAVNTEPEIFGLLFNPDQPLSMVALRPMFAKKHHSQISLLLRRGLRAQRLPANKLNKSPLHAAISQEDIFLVRAGLEIGIDVNIHDYGMRYVVSPLTMAITHDCQEIVDLLLSKGANVNDPESEMNPLTAACIYGRIGTVMALLRLGANLNQSGTGPEGRTALEGAAEFGRLDVIHLLLSNGVETEGLGRRQYIKANRYAQRGCHIQVHALLKRHRTWTEEDEELWNDPNLLLEEEDQLRTSQQHVWRSGDNETREDSTGSETSSHVVHTTREPMDSAVMPALDSTNSAETTDPELGPSENTGVSYDCYDKPFDQTSDLVGGLRDTVTTADPYFGYEHDDDALDLTIKTALMNGDDYRVRLEFHVTETHFA
ncbi:ankyrin repeat-containing domain protein [Apiospora marii]|uniref:Ankyrin repeat-containing domain protein n=1 Tax=Apiospora marii TaxID=335849 RepID=A0ABR1RZP7_9PEZI